MDLPPAAYASAVTARLLGRCVCVKQLRRRRAHAQYVAPAAVHWKRHPPQMSKPAQNALASVPNFRDLAHTSVTQHLTAFTLNRQLPWELYTVCSARTGAVSANAGGGGGGGLSGTASAMRASSLDDGMSRLTTPSVGPPAAGFSLAPPPGSVAPGSRLCRQKRRPEASQWGGPQRTARC